MARIPAAEALAREIDPSTEAQTKRETWSLLQAKANVDMGYAPEAIAARTGWPTMMLTTSLSQARKTWNAEREAERLAEVREAERLEAERQAIQDAEEEAMLVAAARKREADRSDGRRAVALMREHGLTIEDLTRLIEQAKPAETLADVVGDALEASDDENAAEHKADVLAEYEGLVEDVVEEPAPEPEPVPEEVKGYPDPLTGRTVHGPRPTPREGVAWTQPEPVQTGVHVSTADTGHELTPLEQFMAATEPPEGQVIQLHVKKVRDVRNLAWSGEALSFVEQYGMKEFIEAAAKHPTSIDVDPHQADVDYPVERRRRGDMEVSIGFRNEAEPMILYVHLFTGEVTYRPSSGSPQGKGKGSAGGRMATYYPMTANDLIKKAQDLGFTATYGRDAELRWRDGRVAMAVPRGTADRKEIVRQWNRLQDWLKNNTEEGSRAAVAH